MNSSFPNRGSFSYLTFTKYVTNIIAEPKYKYGQLSRQQKNMRHGKQSLYYESICTYADTSCRLFCVCGIRCLCIHKWECVQACLCNNHTENGIRPVRRGDVGMRTNLLGVQIISKSCSFSPETECTPLIVFPTSGFSFIVSVIFFLSLFFFI